MTKINKKEIAGWILIAVALLAFAAAVIVLVMHDVGKIDHPETEMQTKTKEQTETATAGTADAETEAWEVPDDLTDVLEIESLSGYAGYFVEDGTNDIVGGIAALTVKNKTAHAIRTLTFTLTDDTDSEYSFYITALLPGQRVSVLDNRRTPYTFGSEPVSHTMDKCEFYEDVPSLYPGDIRLISGENSITVENISSAAIPAGSLYYKNASGDLLIGGITYSASFPELEPGESVTLLPAHYEEGRSHVQFIEYAAS